MEDRDNCGDPNLRGRANAKNRDPFGGYKGIYEGDKARGQVLSGTTTVIEKSQDIMHDAQTLSPRKSADKVN